MAPSGPAQRLELDLLEGPGVGQDALGGVGAGRPFELGPGDEHEPGAPTRGEALDLVDLGRRVEVLGDPDLAHRSAARGQQLAHGLTALDLVATQSMAATGAPRTASSCTASSRCTAPSPPRREPSPDVPRRGVAPRPVALPRPAAPPRPPGLLRGEEVLRPGVPGRRRRGGLLTTPR